MNDEIELQYPEWQAPLQDVLLEFDPGKLTEKVIRAEAAILERLRELRQSRDGHIELDAISYGLSLLRSVKTDRLGHTDWQ